MAPRREMRREAEAFRARFDGKGTADRHRLLAEHRAFLSGESQNDAYFGDETRDTSAEEPERVPASGIHSLPTGKTTSYIEAAKQRMADHLAEKAAAKKKTASKKKDGPFCKTKTSTPTRNVEFMKMLCPHKRRFADHCAKTAVRVIPKGTFGQYMSKARFGRIIQSLHFTESAAFRAETDRAWKVRSVVATL
ncbi:hypothetical protein PInf_025896 [Phytophthora infestans]|nr:hypothetical protein PInf_025896 [Phytophthora infestans]